MSATSKVALVSPRLADSARARSMVVCDRSSPTVVSPRSARYNEIAASPHPVEHAAVELPLLDQRGQVRLGFTDTPRRFGAGAETADLAPLGGFKGEVFRCGHEISSLLDVVKRARCFATQVANDSAGRPKIASSSWVTAAGLSTVTARYAI
jgi:hypothetical protein